VRAWIIALVLALGISRANASLVALPHHGQIEVKAEAGLEDQASLLADEAAAWLDEISRDLPDLPKPDHLTLQVVRDASSLASVAPAGAGAPSGALKR